MKEIISAPSVDFDVIDLMEPGRDAPETILFHHGLGAKRQLWSGWLPNLISHYRVVRFDLPGHGRSTDVGEEGASMEARVKDVLDVADAANVDRFHFVGESMGGTVGLALASNHPDRVLTLTTCNSPFHGAALPPGDLVKAEIEGKGMVQWSAMAMGMRLYENEATPQQYSWLEQTQAEMSAKFFVNSLQMLSRIDLSAKLHHIRIPVLILGGDNSSATPVTTLSELKDALPDARLLIFPRTKHSIALSRAHECSLALRTFLQQSEIARVRGV